ncbi:unnamed protein product [Toxocara canis]|uniref:Protein-tyrosine-phosphatase n=1 Tax=Toxocara canis TaxID=6265 RepID=A0A183V1G7_TOXCA|nr:unnamed protein product [Toxocara canis]
MRLRGFHEIVYWQGTLHYEDVFETSPGTARVTVSVKVDEAKSVHISMGVSNVEDDIIGYKVYFTHDYDRSDDSFADWQQIDVKSSDRNYILKMDDETLHLKANTKYRLRVTASMPNGESDPSDVVEFQIVPSAPRVPSNVNVVLAPSNSFTVYFDAVLNTNSTDTQSKYINEYTVEFTSDNPTSADAVWKSFNFSVNGITDESKRISKYFSSAHVEPNSNYSLRVFTYDRARGVPSNLVFFETSTGAYSPTVTIAGPSVVKMDPSLNKGYKMKCEATADPPAMINWLVNELPLSDGTNGFVIQQHSNELTTISELLVPTRSRSEVFTCIGSNNIGSDRASVEIKILGPGTAPTDITATSDSLGVHVSWNPPLIPNGKIEKYIVYWTMNENIELADWNQIVLNGNETRTLINRGSQTEPVFVKVQSKSNQGLGIISEKITAKPDVTDLPLKTQIILVNKAINTNGTSGISVEPGEDIEFKCIVEGRPPPRISFYWDDAQQKEHVLPLTMAFRNIPPNTVESYEMTTRTYSSGFLICLGQNARETSEARVFFDVQSVDLNDTKPGIAPNGLHTKRMDNDELFLLWNSPKLDNDTELRYNVYLSDDVSKPIRKWTLLTTNETKFRLTNEHVSPASNYYFRVAAVNELGEGVLSAPEQFSTPTGGPRTPPRSVKIDVDEANVVVISWKRPINANGALTKYTIYFTRDPGMDDNDYKSWQFVDITTAAKEFRYKMEQEKIGLRPKTVYRVRLTASNDVAESEPTEVFEFETTEGELPVPTDVQVQVQKDNAVIIQFTAVKNPEDHSEYLEDYIVLLSPSIDALVAQFLPVAIMEKSFDPNTARIMMKIAPKELSTMTQYWAKVQARIPNQEVQASKPKRFETGDGKVSPVVSIRQGDRVKREPSKNSHLHVECDAEGRPRPVISWLWNGQLITENNTYWAITDITVDPIQNIHRASSRLTASSTSRSGMVTCIAYNNKGHAMLNTSVIVTGPGSVVRDVHIVPFRNAFNISWQEPEVTNGKIQEYIIYMSTSANDELGEWKKIEVNGDEHYAVLNETEPNTDYTFRFQSASELGYGLISDAFTVNSGKLCAF